MILPVILDTCSILNLLRIDDDDEFLYKKLSSLNICICDYVYDEAYKNIGKEGFDEEQREYIRMQMPKFAKYIKHPNKEFKTVYTEEIKRFCNYHKDNGEFYSTLLSLYICREEGCRTFFYTDDFPAKDAFANYFLFQQIGSIGDSVDLLLFLYWANKDFKKTQLQKYFRELYLSYSIPFKRLLEKIHENKDKWIHDRLQDQNFQKNINLLEEGLNNIDLQKIQDVILFFNSNKKKYKEINSLLETFYVIESKAAIAKKIEYIIKNIKDYKIYTKSKC